MHQTTDFLALYRGHTVADARMIAVTAEPQIVEQFVRSLAGEEPREANATRKRGVVRVIERENDK